MGAHLVAGMASTVSLLTLLAELNKNPMGCAHSKWELADDKKSETCCNCGLKISSAHGQFANLEA